MKLEKIEQEIQSLERQIPSINKQLEKLHGLADQNDKEDPKLEQEIQDCGNELFQANEKLDRLKQTKDIIEEVIELLDQAKPFVPFIEDIVENLAPTFAEIIKEGQAPIHKAAEAIMTLPIELIRIWLRAHIQIRRELTPEHEELAELDAKAIKRDIEKMKDCGIPEELIHKIILQKHASTNPAKKSFPKIPLKITLKQPKE